MILVSNAFRDQELKSPPGVSKTRATQKSARAKDFTGDRSPSVDFSYEGHIYKINTLDGEA